ncbi:MAG: GumC family protein [Gemmatimonadales bacterium]
MGLGPIEPQPQGVQWSRYLAAMRRYRWLMLLLTVVGTGLGILSTRFLKPLYTAGATIWIESKPESNGPIRSGELLNSVAWVELLKTGVVLDSTSLRMKLYLTPAQSRDTILFRDFALADRFATGGFVLTLSDTGNQYDLTTVQGLRVESGTPGDSIGRQAGFLWAPPATLFRQAHKVKFSIVTPREASTGLASDLVTHMAEDGNFLRLTLTGNDPNRIAATLNTLTDQFVSVAAELKRRKLEILANTLAEQVKVTGAQLRDAENALESFRVRTITLPSEGVPVAAGLRSTEPTVISNFYKQKLDLEDLRRDRKAMEAVLAKARAGGLPVDAFQSIPAVRNAPDLTRALQELSNVEAELRALRYRYTDEHKPVRDLQDRITTLRNETLPAYASALIEQLRTQEQVLEGQISTAARDLQEIPTRTITEQRLDREKISSENLFQTLQNRYEETKLALASSIPDVKVLDAAVPPTQPSTNSAPRIILMGFLLSLALAVGIAILLDRMDKRFQYPEQVTQDLGLSILGAIPAINKVKGSVPNAEEASQVVEAFRTIRLNLAHSYGAAGPVLLTVTSPGSGDGKSFVSSNLALSFAEAGYRTLLIDGDTRRGELHRMFSLDRRPGLMDYLAGSARVEEIVRPSNHEGLSVMPCGARRHQGPELLGSNAMTKVMAEMKARFGVIIVDSPPLGAGIDPFVLSTATGHMMLVLRTGETDRQMAEAKLKLMDRLPVRILGAVLNDIRAQGTYKYYSYLYGYAQEEDALKPRLAGNGKTEEVS